MDLTTIKQLDILWYIDYYDMNDGWLGFEYISEFRKDRVFSSFTDANRIKNELNEKLPFGNIRCGECYDVKQVPVNP